MTIRTTFNYQCFPAAEVPKTLSLDSWRGLIGCDGGDDRDQLAAMAANKFVRERGGFEGDSYTVVVFCFWNDARRYKNGSPMAVDRIDFKFTRQAVRGGAA